MSEQNIQDVVRQKYDEAAKQAAAGGVASCGGGGELSCCDPITRDLYDETQIAGLPEKAVAASLGHSALPVGLRPRVVVLATGDELVEPGRPLGPGQIRNSNTIALAAQAASAGADVVDSEIVRDTLDDTTAVLRAALESADVVCVSGGVSVGPHDHVKPALAELGVEERFWRVALKPAIGREFGECRVVPHGVIAADVKRRRTDVVDDGRGVSYGPITSRGER